MNDKNSYLPQSPLYHLNHLNIHCKLTLAYIDKKHHNTPSGSVPAWAEGVLISHWRNCLWNLSWKSTSGIRSRHDVGQGFLQFGKHLGFWFVNQKAPGKKKTVKYGSQFGPLHVYIHTVSWKMSEMKWQVTKRHDFLKRWTKDCLILKLWIEGIIHFKWYYVAFWPASSGHFQHHNSQDHTSSISGTNSHIYLFHNVSDTLPANMQF